MFISFKGTRADAAEIIGRKLLSPVTSAFGFNVSVRPAITFKGCKEEFCIFSVKQESLCKRICCVIACILLAPIVLLMTLIGVIAYNCSATYQFTCQRLYIYGLEFDRSSSSKLEEV
ncbi:hypothetical protein C6H88_02275 [Chlamydia muridarum str. Nigg]|uniref:hypothetical protein n=1 Tax=Chlamydia muridarum TaxID=83560 RepID=UPI0009B5CBA0|nr:hypothetical protein [Chlamydia muridarum]UFT31927.1 hypothetical protein FTN65_02380 [Chlamydia trachomatis]AVM88199.1 hypothetical protein C6H96_02275 [Chlamydia muridarum str. Nigg]AVM89092.1 hypothetical protein C6H95_02275 [Chlamydia muridarum str. Nigg]AVM89992.1 hypothetical protein C6H94_02275 [Chlamydia muridarum str. Nigg]AVM90886.1 hypothetical protein C6H93_02270 [Chlamydia muridarum str. Nigg]